ncbi:MAG TPA: 30S ribosomal protein S8 [Candidatus Woesebacteria bacterium]|nr:30S ribosomal protein S8 [Candidatus Woesebacteria bacterium]HPJ16839.1 30S ribosomal protein S8 [Candidatus Woesebacteria bacterium]
MISSLACDFLIRIKNSSLAGSKSLKSPSSKFIVAIADSLKKNGFIDSYSVSEDKKEITVKLIQTDNISKITDVALFSKPGRRWYEKSLNLPWGKTPQSLIIVSTSKGVLSQKEAKKLGLGGEIIAEIY